MPDPSQFTTAAEFQQGLRALVAQAGLTPRQIAMLSDGHIAPTTVWTNHRRDNELATRHAVEHIVRACVTARIRAGAADADADAEAEAGAGVEETVLVWLRAHDRLRRGPAAGPVEEPALTVRGRLRAWWRTAIARPWHALPRRTQWLAAITAVLLVAGGVTGRAAASYDSHCGTFDSALVRAPDGQCAGATDARDHTNVFGSRLQPIMELLAAENAKAMDAGPGRYVTVAFMGLLTSPDPRIVHQLEGAYPAQVEANAVDEYPRIGLVVANQGAEGTHWKEAVTALLTMLDEPDRLLAVAGLGVSRHESVQAARELARHDIPLIGDIITANGFNTTGAIDGKGPIPGLVRVSPNTTSQLNAISKWLRAQPALKTAVLVRASVTHTGSDGHYTTSLAQAFETNPALGGYWRAGQRLTFAFDPRAGSATLKTITDIMCGEVVPHMVFYAARQDSLPTFLTMLRQRPCHTTPITVVTGSDAAALRGKDVTAQLNDPDAPIQIVYAPLADPGQLDSPANPHRSLYQAFRSAFTRSFPAKDLDTGWAITAHDAVTTAITAIRRATERGGTPDPALPKLFAVRDQLKLFISSNAICGASGIFRIDPDTGDRIYDNTHPLTAIRLPEATPAPQQPTPLPSKASKGP
ncbi:hypothetical protein [Nonomuraea sp. NPDC050691]|uniref:ABC transporter substrate-binding protein n=1 Tax=Nonomuraea sp. NPDC050691 TaxID=3155661 RepID=UPI0033FFC6FE